MIFTSPEFVVFFLLFFPLFAVTKGSAKKLLLLGASWFFYGSYSVRFLALIIVSTVIDFFVARAIHGAESARRRKALLVLSIAWNFGVLGLFKYAGFLARSATDGFALFGFSVPLPVLAVALPVGISFYTFQSMGYAVDVYRKKLEPADSILDYAIFVTFFPQLVAGPIERGGRLLPQIRRLDATASRADWSGWGMIALGAFKKVVIADRIATLVDATYASPADTPPLALWVGTYAFAVQIYCDFSGYSDIAVGLARLMGIEIMQNFESPYAADGPSDFWRRWHVSLSTWLRDYLYVSLGGNRGSALATARNLLLTMLLGGLWHGAAWNYVLWGAYHGVLLAVFRIGGPEPWQPAWASARVIVSFVRRIGFFHLTCIGWALFRARSIADCWTVVRKLLDVRHFELDAWLARVREAREARYLVFFGAILVLVLLSQNLRRGSSKTLVASIWRGPPALRFAFVASCLYAAVVLAPEQPPPFIYFQF